MLTGRRHRLLLLMLCAFIVSLLMNASVAASVRACADAWLGDVVALSLAADTSNANTPDTHGVWQQTPTGDASGEDVTFVDDEWVLPAPQTLSLNNVSSAAPLGANVADLPASVALLLRPPDLA